MTQIMMILTLGVMLGLGFIIGCWVTLHGFTREVRSGFIYIGLTQYRCKPMNYKEDEDDVYGC